MLDRDALADALATELTLRVKELDPDARGVAPAAARIIIDAIESLGYVLVRTERGNFTTDDYYEFGEAIAQGIPPNTGEAIARGISPNTVEAHDLDTAAIIYALENAGWRLISPRT